MTNYAKEAAERWPGARILGTDGRYAVVAQNGTLVYLCMTESQQRLVALGIDNPVFANLHAVNFDKIPDRYDADDRRRERRGQ
jgi:Ni,Fe-hydrogenase III large subunit